MLLLRMSEIDDGVSNNNMAFVITDILAANNDILAANNHILAAADERD